MDAAGQVGPKFVLRRLNGVTRQPLEISPGLVAMGMPVDDGTPEPTNTLYAGPSSPSDGRGLSISGAVPDVHSTQEGKSVPQACELTIAHSDVEGSNGR